MPLSGGCYFRLIIFSIFLIDLSVKCFPGPWIAKKNKIAEMAKGRKKRIGAAGGCLSQRGLLLSQRTRVKFRNAKAGALKRERERECHTLWGKVFFWRVCAVGGTEIGRAAASTLILLEYWVFD